MPTSMRDIELSAQLQVSFDEPCHATYVRYPMLDLLNGADEEPQLTRPAFAEQRYEPFDLISDARVAENSSTDNEQETSFFRAE